MFSSLVYLEADASLRTYEDAEGKRQSNLNLVQREYLQQSTVLVLVPEAGADVFIFLGNIEVLKRPFNPDAAPSSESPSE